MLAFGPVEYLKRTLPNGVRILVSEMPETRSASLAIFVGAGSRMESRRDAGTSHFLEHMVFKGTAKRPTAADISMDIERRRTKRSRSSGHACRRATGASRLTSSRT